MPSQPARLLCVGNEVNLLQIRCAVLKSDGYDAESVTVEEAEILLRTEEFDLIIVSAWLEEREKVRVLEAAGKTPALVLTELTFAKNYWLKWSAGLWLQPNEIAANTELASISV
jgi:hypothetical protein